MKKMNICYAILTGVLLLVLAACSKSGDDFLYKGNMLPVTIKGYNGSNEPLIVKIDTFKFKYELGENTTINLSDAYTFPTGKDKVTLTIVEKNTGKLVLGKELNKDDGPTTVSLLYMDGKASEMPEIPNVEAGKIKIIWMFKPTETNYSGPLDIAVGKYQFSPKVFEEITRVKNVKPNEFSEPITLPTFSTAAGQQYNGQPSSVLFRLRIYKAGTNDLYTEGTSYIWNAAGATPTPPSSIAASKLYIFSEAPSGTTMGFSTLLNL